MDYAYPAFWRFAADLIRPSKGKECAMPKGKLVILGVYLDNRIKEATDVQNLLTQYGCNIKTRIGLHEVAGDFCAGYGIILLEMVGEQKIVDELSAKLDAIKGVEVKQMTFSHA
jgi:hypothetical protein